MPVIPRIASRTGGYTAYALACGYRERFANLDLNDNGMSCDLYMEHNCYHVRTYCRQPDGPLLRKWESFGTRLTDARKAYAKAKSATRRSDIAGLAPY